jgi:hypothetical protein
MKRTLFMVVWLLQTPQAFVSSSCTIHNRFCKMNADPDHNEMTNELSITHPSKFAGADAPMTPTTSPLVGRASRRGVNSTTWLLPLDLHNVGATASNDSMSEGESAKVRPVNQNCGGDSLMPSRIQITLITSVVIGFSVRKAMSRRLRVVQASRMQCVATMIKYLATADKNILVRAQTTLCWFVRRWRTWAMARADRRHHKLWLFVASRNPPQSFVDGSISSSWSRSRVIVSWSYYSADASPFIPMHPIQRWMSHVHAGVSIQARKLQKLWRSARFRRAAHQVRAFGTLRRQRLESQAQQICNAIILDEARSWFEQSRNVTFAIEVLEYVALTRRFTFQARQLDERIRISSEERIARVHTLSPLWEDWQQTLLASQIAAECWRESKARHLLSVRSIMKLEALYKEAWFCVYQWVQESWMEISVTAMEAIASNAMVLGPSDLLDMNRRQSTHQKVAGKILRSVTSLIELNELVDMWYARLKHDEAVTVGGLVERHARLALRNKLLVNRPYEDALLDQERWHRALLVKHMINGSLITSHQRASVVPEGVVRQHSVRDRENESVFVSNPPTPHEAAWDETLLPLRSQSPSQLTKQPKFHTSTTPFTVKPPPDRPLRLGKDGFRMGVSKQLERAMSGRRSSSAVRRQ